MIVRGMGGNWKMPWDDEAKAVEIDEKEVEDLRKRIKKVKL